MKITIIAGIIGTIIVQIAFRINKRQIKKKDMLGELEISINHKKVEAKAYIDSGNVLKDPITKEPVIIVEKEILKKAVNINLEQILGGDEKNTEKTKIRIIPFNSIGQQNGMLIGIKPDFIKITFDNTEKYIENVIIGLYDNKISKNYNALIGLELLEGEDKNENVRINRKNVRKVPSKR